MAVRAILPVFTFLFLFLKFKLKEEGIKARSEKNGEYYLVTVGRTKSKGKLEKALGRLKELEYDAYIRKLSAPSDET